MSFNFSVISIMISYLIRAVDQGSYVHLPRWITRRERLVYILGLDYFKTLSGPSAAAKTG